MKIFAGSANEPLAKKICSELGIPLGKMERKQFASLEHYCRFEENLRGDDVFFVQPTSAPANDNFMELIIMADAARRASAGTITAVIPYTGYSRQDRKEKSRVPISAKVVMDCLAAAGFHRIVTMDLHAPQIAGFSNLPFDHLQFKPTFISCLKDKNIEIDVVVAPDVGAVKRSQDYAETLGKDLAIIAKKRLSATKVEVLNFVGNVSGKKVLIVDDLTESAGTLIQGAKTCWDNGASEVNVAVTHPCFSIAGVRNLTDAFRKNVFTRFFYSNTISQDWLYQEYAAEDFGVFSNPNMICVDVAPVFAKAINRIHSNESVSELFEVS
jgi:ribose-phosphate pyrophosphokinase